MTKSLRAKAFHLTIMCNCLLLSNHFPNKTLMLKNEASLQSYCLNIWDYHPTLLFACGILCRRQNIVMLNFKEHRGS